MTGERRLSIVSLLGLLDSLVEIYEFCSFPGAATSNIARTTPEKGQSVVSFERLEV
jgi:hypothetical protein